MKGGWSSLQHLVVGAAVEEDAPSEQLVHDTANGPHVHRVPCMQAVDILERKFSHVGVIHCRFLEHGVASGQEVWSAARKAN